MTVSEQFVSLIIMAASGIAIGAIIDGTRSSISALSLKSYLRRFAFGFELIIWAILGIISFYIIFLVKGGEWRLVDPLTQIFGILLYESLLQPFFRFLGRLFIIFIIRPIVALYQLIRFVITMVFKLIVSIILIMLKPFYKLYTITIKQFIRKLDIKLRKFTFKKK